MSDENKLLEETIKKAITNINWKTVLDLIMCMGEALENFSKPFSVMELAIAVQHLIVHHVMFETRDLGVPKYAG